jgi:hypothetical protein
MKNKSNLKEIIGKANKLSAGEIMAAVNRGEDKINGAEILEKPTLPAPNPLSDEPDVNDPHYQKARAMVRAVMHKPKQVPDVKASHISGIKQKWLEHALKGAQAPMETMKKAKKDAASEVREVKFDAPVTEKFQPKTSTGSSRYGTRNIPMPKPESLHMEGHDHWNDFVNRASQDEEVRGAAAPHLAESKQGIENARTFASNARQTMGHHDRAREIIGDDNFAHVHGILSDVSRGMAEAKEQGTDTSPYLAKYKEAKSMMAHPEHAKEAVDSIHAFHDGIHKAGRYMSKLGLPEEHHGDVFSSAATWEPKMGKSLNKSFNIVKKLKKTLPEPQEEKQEIAESSSAEDRMLVPPKEGDNRPFIGTKETFKQLKERHAAFKKKIEQDREDGDADATSIYSMNEADVSKPLEKSVKKKELNKSKPSYKTLRSAKLPNGTKVNVYGNNGYERISNGPHRGRYLHSVLAEHKLGRKLTKDEEIDHKNGDRKGNGLSNLRLTTTSKHASHTNTQRAKQGGFTGDKRYMHSREYTEGKPESMEKGLADFTTGELAAAKQAGKAGARDIVNRMKSRKASEAKTSQEVATDFAAAQREGKLEDPKGTGAPAWQKPKK